MMQRKYTLLLNLAITSVLILGCCLGCDRSDPLPSCEGSMFGLPIAATGLSDTLCKPSCACKGFVSKSFTATQIEKLRQWQLSTPFAELQTNPYEDSLPSSSSYVCAVVIENLAEKTYHLANFADAQAAQQAGAVVTHYDACGLCSTLADFAVYAENRDIGTPVRQCGIANLAKPFDSLVACIEGLGFTRPCAQIWAYNTRNTQAKCLQPCFNMTTYHNSDGSLSDCLACDELYSGPVFKAVAGRTRRNTGLASSICRLCEEVQPVEHNYPE